MRSTVNDHRLRFQMGAVLLALLTPTALGREEGVADASTRALTFVENRGQWDVEALFLARQRGVAVRVDADAIALRVERVEDDVREGHVVRLEFEGAREEARPCGEAVRPGVRNFYVGSEERWASGVRGYARLRWSEMYPGIDVVLREGQGIVEYDVLVAPHADLGAFVVRCAGVDEVELAEDGALLLHTSAGPIRQAAPKTWMVTDVGPRLVECEYVRLDETRFGLNAPERDPALPLVVDPGLIWSTFLGGSGEEHPRKLHVDPQTGVSTVVGITDSADFPVAGPYMMHGGQFDAFVSRLSGDGSTLLWSTYLGGALDEGAYGLAVGADGGVTVGGFTGSDDFPVTINANQSTRAGNLDAFLSRLDAGTGQL